MLLKYDIRIKNPRGGTPLANRTTTLGNSMKITHSVRFPFFLCIHTIAACFLASVLIVSGCSDMAGSGSDPSDDDAAASPGPASPNGERVPDILDTEEKDGEESEPEEVDATLLDQQPGEYVFETMATPEDSGPEDSGMEATEQSRFWYSSVPEERTEQVAYRNEIRQELQGVRRDLQMIEYRMIAENDDLKTIQAEIGELRVERENLIEHSPEMQSLVSEHTQRLEQMTKMRAELRERGQELSELRKVSPELVDGHHVPRNGCCIPHDVEEDREPTAFELYMQDVKASRALLTKISGFYQEKGELQVALASENPEISAAAQRLSELEAAYRSQLDSHPEIQSLQRQERQLVNKERYLSRVIMGDERYARTTTNETNSN
jgi:hypothetical protein